MKFQLEFMLLCATIAAIILTPVQIGIGIGVGSSLMYCVWGVVQTQVLEFAHVLGSTVWWRIGSNFTGERQPGIIVVGFQAPFFFLHADTFQKSLADTLANHPEPLRPVILQASSIVEFMVGGNHRSSRHHPCPAFELRQELQ